MPRYRQFQALATVGKMAVQLDIKKVLISDKVDNVCKKTLETSGIAVELKPGLSKEQLLSEIEGYDCLIVRSATKITEDVIKAGKKLKLIGRAGTGVDNIDIKVASQHGILVMNTPGGNTMSAAEHTCAMIAALARNIPQGYHSMVEGKWERSKFMGCELNGKTLGIIGLGRIGKEVALRMQSYEMKTIGYDPLVPKEAAAEFGVEFLELDDLWPRADFITVHTPLIPQTKGLVGAKTFPKCKDGVRLINVARGGIIDETDLLAALESGKCAGAGLDVFVTEPPTGVSQELVKHPKVVATPHLGASTVEAQSRVAKEIAEQIVDAVNGKTMVGLVNAPALANIGKPECKCWVEIAEKFGVLLHSLSKEPIKKVDLVVSGENLKQTGTLLSTAVMYGLLKATEEGINMVNAPSIAKDNGIEVNVCHESSQGEFARCLSIRANEIKFNSTVLGARIPVLTGINSVQLKNPVVLDGCIFMSFACENPESILKTMIEKSVRITQFNVEGEAKNSVVIGKFVGTQEQSLNDNIHVVNL